MGDSISPDVRRRFDEVGYAIIRGGLKGSPLLDAVRNEIEVLGRSFDPGFRFDDAASVASMGEARRASMYHALRYLPALGSIGASATMLKICRELGLQMPALMRSYNIRMDMPHQDQYLFHWHQDITYLLGSRNSVTFWIPMGPANEVHGSVELLPASHADVAPFYIATEGAESKTAQLSPKDIRLVEEPTVRGDVAKVDWGDIVAFSQFLVHRSVPNRSLRPRWTIQLRYSDFADQHFRDSGFPFGDMTTILRTDYLGAWRQSAIRKAAAK